MAKTKPQRKRSAAPGGYHKPLKNIESKLLEVGIPQECINYLFREADFYIQGAESGEPTSVAETIGELRRFKQASKDYLNALKSAPIEVRSGVFIFSKKNYMWDQEHADIQAKLETLISNCDSLQKALPKPDKNTHKKYFPRNWIARTQSVLRACDGWNFEEKKWQVGGDFHKLATVIKILNERIPAKFRVSRPDLLIKEVFYLNKSREKRPQKK